MREPARLRVALAAAACAALASTTTAAERPDLTGRWQIDRGASDDVAEKLHEAFETRPAVTGRGGFSGPGGLGGRPPGGFGGPAAPGEPIDGGGGPERIAALAEGYERLTIRHDDPEVEIDYGEDRRTYRADGEKVRRDSEFGSVEVKTRWKGKRLVIERKLSAGAEVREEYSLERGGLRLVLKQKIEGRLGEVEILRVYERAPD